MKYFTFTLHWLHLNVNAAFELWLNINKNASSYYFLLTSVFFLSCRV